MYTPLKPSLNHYLPYFVRTPRVLRLLGQHDNKPRLKHVMHTCLISLASVTCVAQDYVYLVHKPTQQKIHSCSVENGAVVTAVGGEDTSFCSQWAQVRNGDYFYLKNRESDKHLKPDTLEDGSPLVVQPNSWRGNWTQWSFNDRGDGFGHLVNRGTSKHIFIAAASARVMQQPASWRGDYTRWQLQAVALPNPTPSPGASPAPTPTLAPTPTPTATQTPIPPETFSAVFLWDSLNLSDAIDLGFTAGPVAPGSQVSSGPITFSEIGDQVGLANSQAGGNSHGVGIGFIDINNDGWEDLMLANGRARNQSWNSKLYLNNRGQFTDISDSSGIAGILNGLDTYSVAAADYDRDGDLDIHITAHPSDILLQNQGDNTFIDVTEVAGLGGPNSAPDSSGSSKIGAFGDYNGDGLLDLVVASSTFTSAQVPNGYLMRNNGDGTFSDVTRDTRFAAAPTGNPCAVMWSDYNADGHQDLWIWSDRGNRNENRVLLQNQNGATFRNVRQEVGATWTVGNPMGIDAADADHDGYLDYYVSDIGNAFLHNQQNGRFSEIASSSGTSGEFGWGLGFEDFNADSWADIFVAQEDDRPYLSFTNLQQRPPRFSEQRWSHSRVGRNGHNVAVAFADFDRNGTVDVVTASTSGSRVNLFRNDTNLGSNRWLEVKVPVTPNTNERGGISGRVVVKTGDLVQFRDITGGSSRASQNAMSVRFGLGQWTGAEWVGVLWPDGRQTVVKGVEGNQILEIPAN